MLIAKYKNRKGKIVNKFDKLNIKWKLLNPVLYKKRGKVNRQVKVWMKNLNWDK